jgi:hypothetical protein
MRFGKMNGNVFRRVVLLFESELNELFSILATDCSDFHEPVEVVNTCIHCLSMSFVKISLQTKIGKYLSKESSGRVIAFTSIIDIMSEDRGAI